MLLGDADIPADGDSEGALLGMLLGDAVGGTVGATDGVAVGASVMGGKSSDTWSIPRSSSEQNIRFSMKGRVVSASSILICAASPIQQFGFAPDSKTHEHAVQ